MQCPRPCLTLNQCCQPMAVAKPPRHCILYYRTVLPRSQLVSRARSSTTFRIACSTRVAWSRRRSCAHHKKRKQFRPFTQLLYGTESWVLNKCGHHTRLQKRHHVPACPPTRRGSSIRTGSTVLPAASPSPAAIAASRLVILCSSQSLRHLLRSPSGPPPRDTRLAS
jgi:hypothetical protein